MPDAAFQFLGHSETGFPDYIDTGTGRMLIARPGESYGIRAVNEGWPVPPDDGRWDPPYVRPAPAAAGSGGTGGAPPGVPPVPPVPPLPEGGE